MTAHDNDLHQPPAAVSARIREHVAKDIGSARGLPTGARFAIGALAAALSAGAGAFMSDDARQAPAGALTVASVSVAVIALVTGLSMAKASSTPVWRRIALTALPALAFYLVVVASHGLKLHASDAMTGSTGACLMRGGMLALVPLAVLVALWRRSDPFTPRLSGAVLGGWAGLAGAVGLTLACPSSDFWHVAVGHGGAILGGALIGAVLASRWIKP